MRTRSKITDATLETIDEILGGPLTLGRVLYSTRMCGEYTQVEFAKKLKISRQHLCDVEKGRKFVSPALAAEYARILGEFEEYYIRLAIQDDLRRAGLEYIVDVRKAA